MVRRLFQITFHSLSLHNPQFLQFGFGHNAVLPAAGFVIFHQHLVQLADIAGGTGLIGGFFEEALGQGVTAFEEAVQVVVMAFEIVNALTRLQYIVGGEGDARSKIARLKKMGVPVASRPSEIPARIRELFRNHC